MNMSSEPETEAGPHATNELLREEIELRAYFKYCERGCDAGYDVADWLAAEREILAERAAARHAGATEAPETPPEAARREVARADSPGLRGRERGSNRSAKSQA